jgi:hypothetical protein
MFRTRQTTFATEDSSYFFFAFPFADQVNLMIKCLVGSLRAALSVLLVTGAASAFAGGTSPDNVSALVGGDTVSGDQATVALDSDVPNAFSYARPLSGPATATAYLNAHVFCAETPRSATQVSVLPRYQLPASVGNDVWRFPDIYAHSLVYQGGGAQNAAAPGLLIGQAPNLVSKQFRCLSVQPISSFDLPNVSHGLFDTGFGDSSPSTEPAGPHQNVIVGAQVFPGFAGLSVSVVKVETQFDASSPASVVWTLVDGFNTSALSASVDANWCGLPDAWIEGTSPPPQLCDDSVLVLAGVVKQTGPFVRHQFSASVGSTPHYVLVYRSVVGAATSGTPYQGFAALRTGGGLLSVAEESQDWFTNDSVFYNY